ncbi:MAG: zinc-ribbon domain-containing protein [Rickettsiales bacterium]|nr:zinc-ribbon domain-containing protein [Rickettsiales bacterium]
MILQCPKCSAQFNVSSKAVPEEGRTVRCTKCGNEWLALPEPMDDEDLDLLAIPKEEEAAAEAPAEEGSEAGSIDDGFAIDDTPADEAAMDPMTAASDANAETPDRQLPDKFDDGLDDIDMTPDKKGEEGDAAPEEGAADADGGIELEMVDADGEGEGGESPEFDQEVLDELMGLELPQHKRADKPKSIIPLIIGAVVMLIVAMVVSLFAFQSSLQPSMPGIYEMMGMPRTDGLVLMDVKMRRKPSNDKARFIVEGRIINEAEEPRHVPVLRVSINDKEGNPIVSREYEADVVLEPGAAYPFRASRLDTSFVERVDHLTVDLGNGAELMLRD